MQNHYTSASEEQTAQIAGDLAKDLSAPVVICLFGTLGAGKSVFARSLIRCLYGDQNLEVPSPTFTLVQIYETPEHPVYHFDLYRIKDPEEIYELGWEDALNDAITIIEWPENLEHLKPSKTLDIIINVDEDDKNARTIEIGT